MPPAFKRGGTVTAGNSSGINDGAAAVVLMATEKAGQLGIGPLAAGEALVTPERRKRSCELPHNTWKSFVR